MHRAAGKAKDRPVQAVTAGEGFQHRQPDDVPVEDHRLVIPRAPPHDAQRTDGKMRGPARTFRLWDTHGDSLHQPGPAAPPIRPVTSDLTTDITPGPRPILAPAAECHASPIRGRTAHSRCWAQCIVIAVRRRSALRW